MKKFISLVLAFVMLSCAMGSLSAYAEDGTAAALLKVDGRYSAIASLDFDKSEEGCKIEYFGTPEYEESPDGSGRAAKLGGGFYMELSAPDGSSLLSGLDAVIISYDSKTGYLDVNDKYIISITNKTTGQALQIADSSLILAMGADTGAASTEDATAEWKNVTAVFSESALMLYVDGDIKISLPGEYDIKGILSNAVFRIGGQGLIDNVQIFGRAAASDEISVDYNGKIINFNAYPQKPVIVEGRTLVPLRAIFEAMGAEVDWNNDTRTVTAVRGDTTIELAIGSDRLVVNGEAHTIDIPAQIINDSTMVPVRAVAESFNCLVDWNQSEKRVYIKEN